MKILAYPFWLLYRIWFYILVAIPIIVLFPLLIISIVREQWYPLFFRIARLWAKFILIGMGFIWKIEREQTIEKSKSYMLRGRRSRLLQKMC